MILVISRNVYRLFKKNSQVVHLYLLIWVYKSSCNYFDHYLCSPLTEIGGDHPENCCFGLMIVLPVPSCSLPNDYIRRCNRCTDHGTDSHYNSDDEDNYSCDPEKCCCLHFSRNFDGCNRKNIELRYRVFLSRRESIYPCCHEGCYPFLHGRCDGEQNDGHVSDHRVSRSGEINLSSRYETDCSLLSDVGCLGSQSSEASSRRASRRKTSKKNSHRRHSDIRNTQHRSRDYNQSRSERKG